MKNFVLWLGIVNLFLFFPLCSYGQEEYETYETSSKIIEDEDGNLWVEVEPNPFLEAIMHPKIDIEKKGIDDCISNMYSIPFERFVCLFNNDIIGYNDVNHTYKTPLQKEAFKKTEEYAFLADNYKETQECVKTTDFCILYNLRYNRPYNVSKKAFEFLIGVADYNVTNKKGYIGLGNGVCVTFPLKYTQISKTLLDGNYSLVQKITLPFKNTESALKIEKDMENPYCSTYLLFKVRILNVEQVKRRINYGGYVGTQLGICNYLLCKTVGLYIVNTEIEEVLGDFTNLLKSL